jgi:hypothetical protein
VGDDFGNNLMAVKREEMAAQARRRKQLMGGGANYGGPRGGYV